MSSAGRAGSSSGCVTKPKERETGLSGFAVSIQVYSLIGSYVMATAEHREPYELRGSRTCLGARGGEIPPRNSTFSTGTRPAIGPGTSVVPPKAEVKSGDRHLPRWAVAGCGCRSKPEPQINALSFSPHLYRARNLVERFFNKIRQCRRMASRYDKLAANCFAFIQLALIRVWLRVNKSMP